MMTQNRDTAPLLIGTESESSDSECKITYNAIADSVRLPTVKSGARNEPCLVYLMTFMACIGGFLFGYDTGVVSGAMIFVVRQFNLSSFWHELIVSITIGAAAIFALVGGYSNDQLGRKRTILISSVMFIAGALVLGFAISREMLLVGRFIVGIGVGMASSTVPIYISETTPPDVRGRLVTSYNLAITFGLFCASVVDGIFSTNTATGWRFMMGLAAIPALVQFFGFWFMPESPRWLCQEQRQGEARSVLQRLVPADQVELELEAIQFSILDQENELVKSGGGRHSLVKMYEDPVVKKILVLACGLQFFQQFSGINTIMYYSASILQMSGVDNDELAIWLAALVAFTNFIFTFVGIALVDKLGRRPLIIASLVGVVASLSFLAVGFTLAANDSPPVTVQESLANGTSCYDYTKCEACVMDSYCGFCYRPDGNWTVNGSCLPSSRTDELHSAIGRCERPSTYTKFLKSYCPSHYGIMAVLGLGLYLAFFAPGMGPMPWTINSEIFPLWARSAGTGAATSVNWISNLIVSMTFLTLTETITKAGTMWLYASISVFGLIFLIKMLPETKGKALEDIQILFSSPWCSEGSPCLCCGKDRDEFKRLDTM